MTSTYASEWGWWHSPTEHGNYATDVINSGRPVELLVGIEIVTCTCHSCTATSRFGELACIFIRNYPDPRWVVM